MATPADEKISKWGEAYNPFPLPLHSSPPSFNLNIQDYEVTQADIAEFKERGYWRSPKIIPDETLEILRREISRVFEGEVDYENGPYEYEWWIKKVRDHLNGSKKVRKINNAWYVNAASRQLVTSKELGKIAAKFLDTTEIRLWHDQAIVKPGQGKDANSSGNIGWHQDYGYWQCSNSTQMLTAWIPLQDVSLENGAMRTIVGSQKWGLVKGSDTFFEQDLDNLKSKFSSLNGSDDWLDEPCTMKAGQVVFHHCLTFHGSGPNFTNDYRWAYAVHMMAKGTGYQPGMGCHHNVKDLGPFAKNGTLYEGDHFPLIYKSS